MANISQYKDFIPYIVSFYGAGRWMYYNNVENLKSWIEGSASRTNDKESLKMLKNIIKAGIKLIFDYIEEDSGILCIEETVDIIDFEKGEKCLEISVKHHSQMFSKFINKFNTDEVFFDFDIDAIEPNEECDINFREELENYISSLL